MRLLIGFFFSCFLVGCATVFSGTGQQVYFDTKQGGGHLKLYENALYGIVAIYDGPLPASVELKRRKIYKFDVVKDGFPQQTIKMKPSYNTLEALSVPSPTFFAIDGLTGAGREFPDQIIVDLENVADSKAKGDS